MLPWIISQAVQRTIVRPAGLLSRQVLYLLPDPVEQHDDRDIPADLNGHERNHEQDSEGERDEVQARTLHGSECPHVIQGLRKESCPLTRGRKVAPRAWVVPGEPARAQRAAVTLTFASWNHIGEWVRQVDALRRAA